METRIIPILLAGGSGTRLWPISRESFPKQFCKLLDDQSLLQKTAERAKFITDNSDLIIVTNDNYYFLCKDQIRSLGIENVSYILEPCPKNTAPAIALAAQYVQKFIDPDALLLILPSDHFVRDPDYFKQIVTKGVDYCQQNQLLIFGVEPQSPKTGYGYIEKGDAFEGGGFKVKRFVEKPSKDRAQEYLDAGGFYWNSGMFLFKAQDYLNALETFASDIYIQSEAAFKQGEQQNDFFRAHKCLEACRSSSIDYEVMEKNENTVMLLLNGDWNDLGCWSSVFETGEGDEQGNVCSGDVIISKSQNCLISSDSGRVVAIGLKDQIVINTADAVLVADQAYSQDVKILVEQMKRQQDGMAISHKRIYRPWGYYESLISGTNFQVKRLMVNPGAYLSLQLHNQRSEHWVVVEGVADIVNGEQHFQLLPGQYTYIEKLTKHRLGNPGSSPLSVIEIQNGDYLGEDDIVRFVDMYQRSTTFEVTANELV